MTAGVYLLHVQPPYKHAKHYCGCTTKNVEERVAVHLSGNGVPLIRAALEANCTVTIARVWENESFAFEKRLKSRKNTPRYCPICTPAQAQFLYQPGEPPCSTT